jgi:hypothetical protein
VLRAARGKLKTFNANRARDDRIFVNEDLVDNSRKLLSSARSEVQAKNIQGAWTKNCRVMVKVSANSAPQHLKSLDHLKSIVRTAQRPNHALNL